MGEHGWLGELSGIDDCRGPARKLAHSPYIAAVLGVKGSGGISQKSGFCYRLYLPGPGGIAQAEVESAPGVAGPGDPASADAQETRFACYAWPAAAGVMDRPRTFFVDHSGVVYVTLCERKAYLGPGDAPPPEAAYAIGEPGAANLAGTPAGADRRRAASDGNTWGRAR